MGENLRKTEHVLHSSISLFKRGFFIYGTCKRLQTSTVKTFSHSDLFHLRAAQGWMELGDLSEANAELENISAELRALPAVLELRFEICAKELKWDACREIAEAITKQIPEHVAGWLHL